MSALIFVGLIICRKENFRFKCREYTKNCYSTVVRETRSCQRFADTKYFKNLWRESKPGPAPDPRYHIHRMLPGESFHSGRIEILCQRIRVSHLLYRYLRWSKSAAQQRTGFHSVNLDTVSAVMQLQSWWVDLVYQSDFYLWLWDWLYCFCKREAVIGGKSNSDKLCVWQM